MATLLRGFVLVAASVSILVLVEGIWIQMANAVLLALAATQLGMIGHDAGHRQIFDRREPNNILGLFLINFILGFSYSWWVDKHNRHHNHPNRIEHDPDIEFPVLAFVTQQAIGKTGLFHWMIRYQAYLLVPLLSLLAYTLLGDSIAFLWRTKCRFRRIEVLLLTLHFTTFLWLIFSQLAVPHALLFIAVYQGALGIFLGSIFATNHKGMPILGPDTELDYLSRQVVTSRNIRQNLGADFWYGPLANQIEHHLFPRMARSQLRTAEPIVKRYCAEHGISYHETGAFESYREIFVHLKKVGASISNQGE